MDGSDLVAVRANPARLRDLFDLIKQGRLLQLPKHGFRIFEQQPKALGLCTPKRARKASQATGLRVSVLKCCLNDDPHIYGNSLIVKSAL